jgi:hypothetical protein
MKNILLVIALTMAKLHSPAQKGQNRIAEIKKMYAEINSFNTNPDSIICNEGESAEYDSFDSKSEKIEFKQKAKSCQYPNGYSKYSGIFTGYEWANTYELFFKDDKIFFVFITEGAEACYQEKRVYYNVTGNIIKTLVKSNECDGAEAKITAEKTDQEYINTVSSEINKALSKIKSMLK